MKKLMFMAAVAGFLAAAGGVQAQGFMNDYEVHPAVSDFHQGFLANKLELGLRVSYFKFKDAEKLTYNDAGQLIGGFTAGISTYKLEEEQSYIPYPYMRYNILPYLGLQLGWERIEGKTVTHTDDRHSNGNVILAGPSLMLYGRYPLDMFEPYAGAGVVFFSGKFDHDANWHADGRRNMAVDDTTGFLLTVGTTITVYENLKADVSFSSLNAETDARYWMAGDTRDRATWKFPCDSWVVQAGLKYAF